MKDYYAILGLLPNATASQVKEKYVFLAKSFHPDVNKQEAAVRAMADVNEAYETLGDLKRRRAYDLSRKVRQFVPKTPTAAPRDQFTWMGFAKDIMTQFLPAEVAQGVVDVGAAKLRESGIDPDNASPEEIARFLGVLKPERKRRKRSA